MQSIMGYIVFHVILYNVILYFSSLIYKCCLHSLLNFIFYFNFIFYYFRISYSALERTIWYCSILFNQYFILYILLIHLDFAIKNVSRFRCNANKLLTRSFIDCDKYHRTESSYFRRIVIRKKIHVRDPTTTRSIDCSHDLSAVPRYARSCPAINRLIN